MSTFPRTTNATARKPVTARQPTNLPVVSEIIRYYFHCHIVYKPFKALPSSLLADKAARVSLIKYSEIKITWTRGGSLKLYMRKHKWPGLQPGEQLGWISLAHPQVRHSSLYLCECYLYFYIAAGGKITIKNTATKKFTEKKHNSVFRKACLLKIFIYQVDCFYSSQ